MTTNQKGEIAVLKVLLRCAEKGFTFSKPTTEGVRYDGILDDGKLLRVQIKYCDSSISTSDGTIQVELRKNVRRRSGDAYTAKVYSDSEIDLVIVYCPRTDKVYAVPSDVFNGKANFCLRLTPTLNGQAKGCRMASDFEW